MVPRKLVFSLAAIIAVIVILSVADRLLVDLLWFSAIGYREVFDTTFGAEIAIFLIVWLIAFLAIWLSGMIALHLSGGHQRPHLLRRLDYTAQVTLPELVEALGDRVPWKLLVLVAAAILALFVALAEAASWAVYLQAIYGVPFGLKDPAFGLDVGFYVFLLPFLEELRDLFLIILVLTAALTAAVYWTRRSLDFREAPPHITSACTAHLSVLVGLFFVQRAISYWLARYELTLHTNGVVFGLRYVDHVLWKPGLWLLVVLAILAAALSFWNLRERRARLLVAAAVLVFGSAIVLSLAQQ
jgi:uncharacterized protein